MIRLFFLLLATVLPVCAVDVMWKGTGTVIGANSAFQVSTGNKVELTIRYAPGTAVSSAIMQQSGFTRKIAYHGGIRLRIEIKVGTKEWVSFTETISYPLANSLWNPMEVLSVDPTFPPSSNAGDLITFRAYSFAEAKFEKFNYVAPVAQAGIVIYIKDFVHAYNLLNLGQFPDKTILPSRITEMTGQVFANGTDNAFTFSIQPNTLTISDYFPPINLKIVRSPLGAVNLKFNAESDGWYQLYGSADLKVWTPQGIHPGLVNGERTIVPPTNLPKQYFRIERVPPPF